jgi:HWE histidine kinase
LKPKSELEMAAYFAASGFIIRGAESYRRLVRKHRDVARRLLDEEKLRKVAVEELSHRLKNKIATIQSIVSYQLRGYPNSGTRL